jgi:crotonyl-CoA carboxylase/reductase
MAGARNPFRPSTDTRITSRVDAPHVYVVGAKVKRWKVRRVVVLQPDDGDDEECNGGDPSSQPQRATQ